MDKIVYLDNNATTKVDEKVVEKMLPYFCKEYGNPSSTYTFGGNVQYKIIEARETLRDFIGASRVNEIIFTSCGTESANTAIKGILTANKTKKHIITTKVEHACVLTLYKNLETQFGYKVDYLDVNSDGSLDLTPLENMVNDQTALVSCMAANNETGVIFPYEKLAEIVKTKNPNTKVFVDAVQAAGKIKLDVKNTQVDLMGISGHKIHAPKGIGALYIKSGTLLSPLLIGGHQEAGKRAGTENVPYIIGLAEACKLASDNLGDEATRVKQLRDTLEAEVIKRITDIKINGKGANRVSNTTNISFKNIEGEAVLLLLDGYGICCSSGSACSSGTLEPSPVLQAMGVPFEYAHSSTRFSMSLDNTMEDIMYTADAVEKIVARLRDISPYRN